MKKRILSILLTAIMLLSVMPMTASGASAHTHGTGAEAITFDKEIKNFDDLKDLFDNGGSGYLSADITCTEAPSINQDVNLCLNGKMIDLAGKGNILLTGFTKLNLYDCGNTVRKWDTDSTGLWVPAAAASATTKTTVGGVITGGSASEGAGIFVGGTLNMYGGNIAGNTASENGGGLFILFGAGKAVMYGGNIIGNTAANGGGAWLDDGDKLTILGGSITENTATEQGGGIYYETEACLAKGTMITLNDGTRKPVEELDTGDDVRVFDHEAGTLSHAKISDYWHYGEPKCNAFTLHFSNDINVTAVTAHSFYEKDENKYVSLNIENAESYIGHYFYNADAGRWETLESVTAVNESVETYLIATEKHLDCITEGMLSCEDDIYTVFRNVFEFDKNMMVDEAQKAEDIADADGLWSYDDCPLFTKESFDALNLQYAKVAVNKGMISYEDIEQTAVYCSILDTGHFENNNEKKTLTLTAMPKLMAPPKLMTPPEDSPSVEDFEGLTIGGNAQVKNNYLKKDDKNTANNIYLTSEAVINLATGKYAPGNDMLLYVSIEAEDDVVPIAGSAGKDDLKYFRSDDPKYMAAYDTENSLINLKKSHYPHNLVKISGQKATVSAAGFKDYYECKNADGSCGALFEDENGTIPIYDLETWKSEGGAGYIPKLEEEPVTPVPPKAGDMSNMTLWITLFALSVAGLGTGLILWKRKRK